jgi:hypothetical protein
MSALRFIVLEHEGDAEKGERIVRLVQTLKHRLNLNNYINGVKRGEVGYLTLDRLRINLNNEEDITNWISKNNKEIDKKREYIARNGTPWQKSRLI